MHQRYQFSQTPWRSPIYMTGQTKVKAMCCLQNTLTISSIFPPYHMQMASHSLEYRTWKTFPNPYWTPLYFSLLPMSARVLIRFSCVLLFATFWTVQPARLLCPWDSPGKNTGVVIHMFQCYSPKSSHPHLLLQSPKVCSLHLGLFCCLAYRVVITIFQKPPQYCKVISLQLK